MADPRIEQLECDGEDMMNELDKLRAENKTLRETYDQAFAWSLDIAALIEFSSKWIHDSTLWDNDDELGPRWQGIWSRAPAPLDKSTPRG